MLLNTLLNTNVPFGERILTALLCIVAILPALTFHEWAHGFAAYKLGDSTAKADGRLSLNPLDHLDPVGSLLLLLVGFGWAKPVPVNTRYFKKPKRDFAIVSLAGPLTNFILAIISAFLYVTMVYCSFEFGWDNPTVDAIIDIFKYALMYNVGLGVFNLIPLPPLDGSNVLMCVLPHKIAAKYAKLRYYTRYIFIVIILLTWLPEPLNVIDQIISWPIDRIITGCLDLANITISNLFSFTVNFI